MCSLQMRSYRFASHLARDGYLSKLCIPGRNSLHIPAQRTACQTARFCRRDKLTGNHFPICLTNLHAGWNFRVFRVCARTRLRQERSRVLCPAISRLCPGENGPKSGTSRPVPGQKTGPGIASGPAVIYSALALFFSLRFLSHAISSLIYSTAASVRKMYIKILSSQFEYAFQLVKKILTS